MKKQLLLGLFSLSACCVSAQQIYEINAPKTPMTINEGQLRIGGSNSSGGSIMANNHYLSQDSKPIIPIIGEFHYCRYPHEQWEEQLLKMKAGGVNIVSTYVFWNIHEQKRGEFNWSGDLDLRRFVQLCQKLGFQVIVRIGPFDHGEIRNGGLPDWLYSMPVDVRSNDKLYLHYAKQLFTQIATQLKGLYYKDNGPIIGIQLENEHQHAAAGWALSYMGRTEFTSAGYDEAFAHLEISPEQKKITTAKLGDEHMMTLKQMAEELGMIVPIYTATGWGNAAVLGNEGLPVCAAYPYATWTDVTARSPYCLFTDLHKKPDYSPVRYRSEDYPVVYAEMGCGIQMGYSLRPKVYPKGIATMLLRSIGSGTNGFGYYMYHGGSSPKMSGGYAYFSDGDGMLPRISYDFQAPLGENGLEHESYRRMRMLHLFINDFQQQLAPMETVLPDGSDKLAPEDVDHLRYAARMKDGSGFLFLINYQDHEVNRHDMMGIRMKINLNGETLYVPAQNSFTLPKDVNMIMPFNMKMDGALLKYATAQPLMIINDREATHYMFFVPDGINPEFLFDKATVKGKYLFNPVPGLKSTFTVKTGSGKTIRITTLTESEALNAAKVNGKMVITDATLLPSDHGATLLSLSKPEFSYIVYPSDKGFATQYKTVAAVEPSFGVKKYSDRLMTVHFNDSTIHPQIHEYFLQMDYTADVAMAFLDNELVDDDFWHGQPWIVALNRFKKSLVSQDMTIRLRALKNDNSCLKSLPQEVIPDFSNGSVLDVKNIRVVPEYQTDISF